MSVAGFYIGIIKACCKLTDKLKLRRIIQKLISDLAFIYDKNLRSCQSFFCIIFIYLIVVVCNFSQLIVSWYYNIIFTAKMWICCDIGIVFHFILVRYR